MKTLAEPTLTADPERALAELLGTTDDGPGEPRPTRLTIHRTSAEDCRDRQVIFTLDGEPIGQLLFGQTLTLDVTPGTHRLRANNTLVWKTAEVLAPAGAHVHYTCINYVPRGMFYMLAMFGVLTWKSVPVLPIEIMLLPMWSPFHLNKISYWARTTLVPRRLRL